MYGLNLHLASLQRSRGVPAPVTRQVPLGQTRTRKAPGEAHTLDKRWGAAPGRAANRRPRSDVASVVVLTSYRPTARIRECAARAAARLSPEPQPRPQVEATTIQKEKLSRTALARAGAIPVPARSGISRRYVKPRGVALTDPGRTVAASQVAHLSNREKLGMDQVFVVWTSKSGLNQMGLVF